MKSEIWVLTVETELKSTVWNCIFIAKQKWVKRCKHLRYL